MELLVNATDSFVLDLLSSNTYVDRTRFTLYKYFKSKTKQIEIIY